MHKLDHHWSCTRCRGVLSEINKRLKFVEVKVGRIEKRVDEAEENVDQVTKRVDRVEDSLQEIKEQRKMDSDSMINKASNNIFREIAEMKAKESNLVIHNFPEPESTITSGLSRKARDKEALKELVHVMESDLDVEDDLKFFARPGTIDLSKDDPISKPRPLLLGFKSINKKEDFLKSACNLKNSKFNSVSIVTDLTARQRRAEKDMREECKKNNEEMNPEEALNWEWKVLGTRGQRQIRKVRRINEEERQNPNFLPLGQSKRGGGGRQHSQRETRSTRKRSLSPEVEKPPEKRQSVSAEQ